MSLESWMSSKNGLGSKDVWNIRILSEVVIDNEPIGYDGDLRKCVEYLVNCGGRPVTTYDGKPKWVKDFFEEGSESSIYDGIWLQIQCSGENITSNFWIGVRLPNGDEIKEVSDLLAKSTND